jgi:hypothetical protein
MPDDQIEVESIDPRVAIIDQIPLDNGDMIVWWRDVETGVVTREVVTGFSYDADDGSVPPDGSSGEV